MIMRTNKRDGGFLSVTLVEWGGVEGAVSVFSSLFRQQRSKKSMGVVDCLLVEVGNVRRMSVVGVM